MKPEIQGVLDEYRDRAIHLLRQRDLRELFALSSYAYGAYIILVAMGEAGAQEFREFSTALDQNIALLGRTLQTKNRNGNR